MPSWFDNVTAAAAVKLLMRANGQRDRAEYDRSIDVGIPVAGPSNPQHAIMAMVSKDFIDDNCPVRIASELSLVRWRAGRLTCTRQIREVSRVGAAVGTYTYAEDRSETSPSIP
jgi:hypothetical protein